VSRSSRWIRATSSNVSGRRGLSSGQVTETKSGPRRASSSSASNSERTPRFGPRREELERERRSFEAIQFGDAHGAPEGQPSIGERPLVSRADAIEVPPDALSPEALRALVEEFVTRDGTDYGAVEPDLDAKGG
jgi:hypothetical protein